VEVHAGLKVNLLPPELRAGRPVDWGRVRRTAAGAAAVAAVAALFGWEVAEIRSAERQLASAQAAIAAGQYAVDLQGKLTAAQRALADREAAVAKSGPSQPLDRLLLSVARATPPDAWLEELSVDEKGVVRLAGKAENLAAVPQFMANLAAQGLLRNLSVSFPTPFGDTDGRVPFAITATLAQTGGGSP
jgi:hypothetical protein